LAASSTAAGSGRRCGPRFLALAFDGLGAEVANSGYFEGNAASARVSEKLGYLPDGDEIHAVDGSRVVEHKVRATPQSWQRTLVPVAIEGLAPCLELFGAGELGPEEWATF